MPIKEEDYQLNFIRKELEDSRERNFSLERENDQLKQEVARLRAKISSLKAQTLERKSSLRKKLSTSIDVNFQEDCSSVEKTNTAETVTKTEKLAKPVRPSTKTVLPDQVDVKKVPPPPAQPPGNTPPPPPPPPPPSKFLTGSANVVRRVPGVMEFYRSLTRKDTKVPNQNSFLGVQLAANTRNMIGEIENRSRYLMAIKSDVETQGGMIRYLTREVENAAYTDISDVETFVRWLDRQLSSLVDERAVLKHFPQWPEQKADAMREASFTYRDLKNLESEVTSFTDNPKEPVSISLKRMQALQDRLEGSVHGVERTRESLSKKYREYRIPWDWMLDTGMIKQLKLSSMGLAKEYMRRVTRELQSKECSQEDLMLQGARFAFRVHQFAGGFDTLAMQAFEEFRKMDTEHGQPQHGISGI